MGIDASTRYDEPRRVSGGAIAALVAKARSLLADRSDTAVAQKVAGGAFLIRIVNACLAFASQILLARWMGESEYGVYVYVWTWVLLLGGVTGFGLGSSPQRFIPEYAESESHSLLRGFLVGSRLMAAGFATGVAAIGMVGIWLFADSLESYAVIPLYLALICVPMYVVTDVQDGIARTHNWIDVALTPTYIVRPLLILALLAGLSFFEFAPTAVTAMAATVFATWATALAQLVMLERRLRKRVPSGPRAYDARTWMKVSLPISMVEGFYLLLAYTDVLVLSAFREPHEVGVYYAAVKVMSLVAFVSFSVSAAVSHRFTEYAVAGEQERLATMVRDAARWTFWPSLAGTAILLALGWPLLWLFGEAFTEGYPLLFLIAIGLLARATVGPLERLLNMLGEQNRCAAVYFGAFAVNLALCIALVPYFGMAGAAAATSATMVVESILLFWMARTRLGLGALPWGRSPTTSSTPDKSADAARPKNGVALPVAIAAQAKPTLRTDAPAFRFELGPIDSFADRGAAWDNLAARALEPNVFCTRDFALAARRLKGAAGVEIAAVWDESAVGPPRLVAIAAVQTRRALPFGRMLASTEWAHFGPLGAPLLDRQHATLAAEALLDGLASRGGSLLLLRFLPEQGPTADAIRAAVAFSGRSIVRIDGHERALLRTDEPAEAYLGAALSPKKLKELRRQLRRLGDEAPVTFRESRTPEDVAAALERYLDVEARGWKGAGGTAMRRHADQLAFIRELLAARAASGEARALELTVGDQTVAAGLVLISGARAWFYKIAFDERFSRCSPGVQLTVELTRRLIEDPAIGVVDSTAVADHPMIDHIWRERLPLGDWMIALRPGAARRLRIAASAEMRRRRARAFARALYLRVKDRAR
jgi:O-antigen/teichoic acid export membrane protein/CelD/BcsL family acetyltransferase involved in cellulose biosynthesis